MTTSTARLDSIDNAITARLAPHKGDSFIVWHPSLSYFARDYGLNQVVVGGSEHKESSIADLKESIDTARNAELLYFLPERFRQPPGVSHKLGTGCPRSHHQPNDV